MSDLRFLIFPICLGLIIGWIVGGALQDRRDERTQYLIERALPNAH